MTLGYASKAIDDLRKMRGRGYFSDDKFIDGLIDRMRGAVVGSAESGFVSKSYAIGV